MSLRRNVIFGYASQIYVTLISIVMVPFYVKYMGAEAYGLVGFFAMLQAWFQLLDMGLTPTMARQVASYQGGGGKAVDLWRLLRALEAIFIAIAVAGAVLFWSGSSYIANHWLKVEHIQLDDVEQAVQLMAIIVALRWVCGLYRGAISGFERLVWLGTFNATIATLRFVMVIPLFLLVGTSPIVFFAFQLFVSAVELVVLVLRTYNLLPKVEVNIFSSGELWAPLRGVLKFSLSVAFTSSVWVMVTQTDKLVLSKILTLSDYAHFTLAVVLAGGVMVLCNPISAAVMPRMTRLSASGDDVGLLRVYRDATQLVSIIAFSVGFLLAATADHILLAWTGDQAISDGAAPILRLYAVGNSVLAVAAFPYYLQYAKGDLKLHLIGNALLLLTLLPTLILGAWKFGAVGAGYAWVGAITLYFLFWLPLVHARFFCGLHRSWVVNDIAPILALTAGVDLLGRELIASYFGWPIDRISILLCVGGLGAVSLLLSSLGSRWVRGYIGISRLSRILDNGVR